MWNANNRAQGHCNIELNETGIRQAQAIGQRLAEYSIEQVFASDLLRCQQTIAPFVELSGCAPTFREDLRERTFGSMEGEDYTELHRWMRSEAQRLGLPETEVRPPGGESTLDVWNRVHSIAEELRTSTKNTLIVSHGGALAQLVAQLIKGSHETARSFRFANCGLSILESRVDGSFILVQFNDIDHLQGIE